MKKLQAVALLLCLCLLWGCSDPGPVSRPSGTTQPQAPAPETDILDIDEDPLPYEESELYRLLFDSQSKLSVDIHMADSELLKLQQDYEKNHKSPIYRRADLDITIENAGSRQTYRIRDVGVRMKGNSSRTDFYNPEEGIYNVIHLKIDFQETFDDEECYGNQAQHWESEDARQARKDRTFATLEKLEMRWNKCYDSTYLKESYAYELYRSQGVMAPLVNLGSLQLSGLHMGIFTVSEPVDKVFLEKRLPEQAQGGDLYKLGWTHVGASFTKAESIGIEDELKNEFYTYDLKTNKKKSQHEALKHLIAQLNSGNVTKESFASLVDVDNFLAFAAVSYFVGNPDDLRNNYNNCYLYFRKDNGKAMLIPYDVDRCLGVTYEWNPSGNGMTTDDPFSAQRLGQNQENPLFLYSVVRGGYYVKEYAQALAQVAQDPLLRPETFRTAFDGACSRYGALTQPDKTFTNAQGRDWQFSLEGGPSGNLSFEAYITAKMATYEKAMEAFTDTPPQQRPTHYIRGDFNGWSSQPDWAMTDEDGQQTFTLTFGDDFRFKIYAESSGKWYGEESLPESDLVYTTDNHGNVCLPAGTYRVIFDPETEVLTVIKQ